MRAETVGRWLLLGAAVLVSDAGAAVPAALQPLQWMLGHWQREGLPAGSSGEEHWERRGDAFVGTGSRRRAGAVVFVETLRLEADGDTVSYVADVAENPQPVRFALVAQTSDSAVFENLRHDFPKRISYQRRGDALEVVISGDGRQARFAFRRAHAAAAD